MKKVVFILLTITAFLGCSENQVDLSTENAQTIQFSNLRERVTRADKAGANDDGDNYKIYSSVSISPNKWYIEDTIVGDPTDPKFNQAKSGPYFWLNNVLFDFYAYAPAAITATGMPGNLTIDYVVKPNADEDFTIAVPQRGMTYVNTTGGVVNLRFKHILTKINVNVDLHQDLKDAGYSIEASYTANLNVLYNRGTVVLNNTTDVAYTSKVWSRFEGSNATYIGAQSYIVLPQHSYIDSNNKCSVQLKNVTIKKNGITVFPVGAATGDLDVYEFKSSDIQTNIFQMGKQYNLNFTINDLSTDSDGNLVFGEKIKFSATHADWSEVAVSLTQE